MAAPISGVSTNSVQIEIDWTALTGTSTGNSAIIAYNLYWDNGSGTTSISLVNSLVTSYIIVGVTTGTPY